MAAPVRMPLSFSFNHLLFLFMKSMFTSMAAFGCGLLMALAETPSTLTPLLVEADAFSDVQLSDVQQVQHQSLRSLDAAELVSRLPGVAIARNGPQSGILQLRGLSGNRVGVRVDGMTITPACPNHMDPPLHYADAGHGSLVKLYAGVTPVSEGGDSLGGNMSVSRPDPQFSTGSIWTRGGVGASFLGSQDATRFETDIQHAEDDLAFQYRGSAATAGDLKIPGGRVRDSGYDMTRHGIVAAWKTSGGFIEVDAGFAATRDAGTPALPMDMVSDDAWNLGFKQKEAFGWGIFEQRVYVHDIEHLMDNYSNRPAPGMMMEAPSSSRDYGWQGGLMLERDAATLRFGVDLHRNEFDAEQVVVMSSLRRDMFEENRRSRYGVYADWEHDWSEKSTTRMGLRSDWVTSRAAAVSNQFGPPAVTADQAAFNAADRSAQDCLVDAVAAWRFKPDDRSTWELVLGVKNRAPSLLERYLWTPLGASAGLADGRNYLGDPGIDPETAHQISLGYELREERWMMRVTPFYQIVTDYIDGVPLNRLDSNSNPVLQFANLDRADLYGCEWVGEYAFTPEFAASSTVSYVRGRNKDTGDDLYRIAPLHGMVDFTWRTHAWEVKLESEWAAAQNDVAAVQGEPTTPGYGIFHLRLAHFLKSGMRVEVGLENLLDKRYVDHLGGINRVSGSDVAVGGRIPGAGRFAYVSMRKEF